MSGVPGFHIATTPRSLVAEGESIIERMDRWIGFARVSGFRCISQCILLSLVAKLDRISSLLEAQRATEPVTDACGGGGTFSYWSTSSCTSGGVGYLVFDDAAG